MALGLSVCGGTAATASVDDALPGIYTAAALTVPAAGNSAASTGTVIPTVTPTLQATAIPTSTSTQTYGGYSSGSAYAGCEAADYLKDVTIPDGTVLDSRRIVRKDLEVPEHRILQVKLRFLAGICPG